MKFKEYSVDVWSKIDRAIAQAKKEDPHPVAAFDADGTLWDTDLGEMFFKYKIANNMVPMPNDPWQYYQDLKKKNNDPREAYVWLAKIMKGVPICTVKSWAQSGVDANSPIPVFNEQKKLIEKLLLADVQVFIVTASIKWAVEPGSKLVGLQPENVIGVMTEVVDGKVTDKNFGIMTYRKGKADALLQATGGKYPFLASGNSIGDFELLSAATKIRLCVSAATSENQELYSSEKKLFEMAAQANSPEWILHHF
ncbi:MAG: HAD family hydrolase [Pseudobdellovibrionaceae bacterium]